MVTIRRGRDVTRLRSSPSPGRGLSLLGGPSRFTEVRDKIGGMTPKVLTQTLRAMERDGLLTRQIFAEVPPRVEYTLTPLGRSLGEPIMAITDWAERNVHAVMSARGHHDTTTVSP